MVSSLVVFGSVAQAATGILDGEGVTPFSNFLTTVTALINQIMPLLIGLIVLAIVYGLVRYAFSADDPGKRKGATDIMLWGVIILFVAVSIWGFVNFLDNVVFGTGAEKDVIDAPEIPEYTP